MDDNDKTLPQEVQVKPLSRKELKKQKKLAKKQKRQEEKRWEKAAGRKPTKILALIFSIIGFISGLIPIILIVGALIVALLCYMATIFLFIFYIFGIVCFGIGFFIYASGKEGATINQYLAQATVPANFGTDLVNSTLNISGLLTTIFAGVGLALQITALICLFASYKALIKRHKVSYTIWMFIGIIITTAILVWGILNI